MTDDASKRRAHIADMMPDDWDARPYGLADEIRGFLDTIKDVGTAIDTGSGNGIADLWVTIQGTEFLIQIRPNKPR